MYPVTPSGAVDLRLKQPKEVAVMFRLDDPPSQDKLAREPLRANPTPQVDFSGVDVPTRLTAEIMSYFPKAANEHSLVLDLGCGNAIHRGICEHAGFIYAGVDYMEPGAPYFGDAHALPFRDESFEFVLSIAVLEHLRFPFQAVKEIYRVLKPGGVFVGTVAFMEPFHSDSYYHHTHYGLYNLLNFGRLSVDVIAPSPDWSVFKSVANMAAPPLFPQMPPNLARKIVRFPHTARSAWYKLGRIVRGRPVATNSIRDVAGSFSFVAHRSLD